MAMSGQYDVPATLPLAEKAPAPVVVETGRPGGLAFGPVPAFTPA